MQTFAKVSRAGQLFSGARSEVTPLKPMCSIPRAHTMEEEILLPQIVFDLCIHEMAHACLPQIM